MMMRVNDRGVRAGVAAAMLLTASAGTALAQNSAPSRPDPALRGPAVRDNSIPGQKGRFAPGQGVGKERLDGMGQGPRPFMQALSVLRGEKAAEDVRLTKEQNESLREIHKEFADSFRAFMDGHKEEIKELRGKLSAETRAKMDRRLDGAGFGRPVDGPGRRIRPGKDGKPLPPDAPPMDMDDVKSAPSTDDAGAKQKLMDLLEQAPKPKDAESKAWAVLTDQQRPLVEAELKRLRENPGPPPGGPGAERELPPQVRERLESMTPEQREKFLEKFKERRGKGRGDGNGKPAPEMDGTNPPPPPPPPPGTDAPRRRR